MYIYIYGVLSSDSSQNYPDDPCKAAWVKSLQRTSSSQEWAFRKRGAPQIAATLGWVVSARLLAPHFTGLHMAVAASAERRAQSRESRKRGR